jgi:hypothetical protein
MSIALERNERLRRDLVSDVAHELRTPLTNLRGQLEALQDGLRSPTPEVIDSLHGEALALQARRGPQDLSLADAGGCVCLALPQTLPPRSRGPPRRSSRCTAAGVTLQVEPGCRCRSSTLIRCGWGSASQPP